MKVHLVFVSIFFVGVLNSLMFAQIIEREEKELEKAGISDFLGKKESKLLGAAVPMEGVIDPVKYVMGPSDVVSLSLWGAVSFSYPLTVTPEGTLIIPTVGEISVSGKSLAEAKRLVEDLVRKKYKSGDISMTLLSPRSFVVTLRGSVLTPGQYVATAVDRVEKIVNEGTKIQYPSTTVAVPIPTAESYTVPYLKREIQYYKVASMRNILLIRRDGDTLRVDIPKFYGTGDDRYNPYLLDGDIILVQKRSPVNDFISVLGAVNDPGQYEYVEGDSVLDAIRIAQGFMSLADQTQVVLTRLDDRGEAAYEKTIDLKSVLESGRGNLPLQRGDRVLVKQVFNEKKDYQILIGGEIKNPGSYPITRSSTRLSDLIESSGGFNENALLSAAVLFRKDKWLTDVVDAQFQYARHLRANPLFPGDSTFYFLEQKNEYHPVVVDFVKLFLEHDTTQNITLRDGDVIYIPSNLKTVIVGGQVLNPGHIPFIPNMQYNYYIKKAGGFLDLAVEGDVKVIKKSTLAWVDPGETTIEPGDQIWVPKRPIRDFQYYFSFFRDIVGLTASLATVVILAIQVNK